MNKTIPPLLFLALFVFLSAFPEHVQGQETGDQVTVQVDWMAEVIKGGVTSVALIALFMFGVTFTVERLLALRGKFVSPDGLPSTVAPLWHEQKFEQILNACTNSPSTLGRMIEYLVHHRKADPGLLIAGAQDIASREMKRQRQKLSSLAVVAALAPLLGLLGTMIGMIESFKLVEIYGDDGGASLLAGSISKALITTAVGLIIAIGALAVYHSLKARLNSMAHDLEVDLERLVNLWLMSPASSASSKFPSAPTKGTVATTKKSDVNNVPSGKSVQKPRKA